MKAAGATTKAQQAKIDALRMQRYVALRMIRQQEARNSLLAFTEVTMPDPDHPDDWTMTKYAAREQHRFLCSELEAVARGECLRLIISLPPQNGKSELTCRRFQSWLIGRMPHLHLMFGTYNQEFANLKGDEVRETLESDRFQGIFTDCRLMSGSRAKNRMRTTAGGSLSFLGRGGPGTGQPANGWVLDDIIKNAEEADSPTIREQAWQWFTKVVFTRIQATSFIIIIATRWSDDDVIGRLTDPSNPCYDKEEAERWKVINIPAVLDAKSAKLLGRKEGEALWPERQPLSLLASAKKLNPRGFQALYMGNPAPEDGDYFKREWFTEYEPHQLPKSLRIYGASDHALTEKQENDASVIGCVGVDKDENIWVLPDLAWGRWETDVTVEELIAKFKTHRPGLWFAEDEHIRKSIGPFLRKRQREMKAYTTIQPITPTRDLRARARSIQGRMALGMLRFPKDATWWPDAKHELLRFPRGAHDDFVSFLALIGLGLDQIVASKEATANDNGVPREGTFGRLKYDTRMLERRNQRGALPGGW